MNDIAKYGIMTMTSKVLSPLQYKSLMYLIWKNLQKTPGQIDCGHANRINKCVDCLGMSEEFGKISQSEITRIIHKCKIGRAHV